MDNEMGGKALLPQVPDLRRLTPADYKMVTREVLNRLNTAGLGVGYGQSSWLRLIPSYENKESFGDADFVMSDHVIKGQNWRKLFADKLNSSATFTTENSMVTSFEYKKFQVDIIVVPKEDFDFAYNYYSYNDLGNLIGRVARSMGFKFGHNGLWLEVMEGTNKLKEICITKEFQKALAMLGFNNRVFDPWTFRKLTDVFEFVTNGTYFNKEPFLMENRNHAARVRDAKRTTYTQFLEYIQPDTVVNKYVHKEGVNGPWVATLKKAYPEVIKEYFDVKEEYRINQMVKQKFNGDIVAKITKLKGPELGQFLTDYRATYSGQLQFSQFVLASQPDTLAKSIEKFLPGWIKEQAKKKANKERALKAAATRAKKARQAAEAEAGKRTFFQEKGIKNKSVPKKRNEGAVHLLKNLLNKPEIFEAPFKEEDSVYRETIWDGWGDHRLDSQREFYRFALGGGSYDRTTADTINEYMRHMHMTDARTVTATSATTATVNAPNRNTHSWYTFSGA